MQILLTAVVLVLAQAAERNDMETADRPERVETAYEADTPAPVRTATPHPVDVLESLEIVLDQRGRPVAPWERTRGCVGERCVPVVRHAGTGEIGSYDGEWLGGFVQTGRGEEVVRIRRPEAED